MNTEYETLVFCSECDRVTSDFVEFAGYFYCTQQCLAYLPTPEAMEAQSSLEADAEWLASAGFGDDEDYGYF